MTQEEKTPVPEEQEVDSVHKGILDAKGKSKTPWLWVPSAYFAEGIPYILAMTVSVIMYKKMGVSNKDIAYYTSWLYLPWVIKPLWSPIVDIFKTKRWWVYSMQLVLAIGMIAVALVLPLPNFFKISLVFLFLIAFSSATHDIACDGFYMLGLSKHQQAWFVGIRASFYRLAMIMGQGFLVIIAGWIEAHSGLPPVNVNVSSTIQSKPEMEYVKYIPLEQEHLDALKNKPAIEKLRFFLEQSKDVANLDESASLAYQASKIVDTMRKDDPDDPQLNMAQNLYRAIAVPMDKILKEQLDAQTAQIQPLEGEARIVVSSENYEIPIQLIPEDDSNLTLFKVKRWNLVQGQQEEIGKEMKKKTPGPISTAWNSHVVKPLETGLRKIFPAKETVATKLTGNIGYIYFHLSKPPADAEPVTVTFGWRKGDKSLKLGEGTRFIFTKDNWNKPVMAAIQLDKNLLDVKQALFVTSAGNIPLSWSLTFGLMAALFFFFAIYHLFVLPYPHTDTSRYMEAKQAGVSLRVGDFVKEFFTTFVSFFKKKDIIKIIIFLSMYRFAEAQLVKMNNPFFLDSRENGGLNLTTSQVGIAYGTVGLLSLTLGGILGGMAASKWGLKKCLWWMFLSINIPDFSYVILSRYLPTNFGIVCALVGAEALGYGFGYTAYMLYMIYAAEGPHKTAHFAICTGFMALGMMIPGMFSGWVQSIVGYQNFFWWVIISIIPCAFVTLLIKVDPEFGKKKKTEA
ncbi:MAG TPA: hypothetical protein P5557_12395 [Candidatus Sumerlaeia bacterium]|nr:hypothetical protein [Candidatus Sumerlaeia bacterium]